LHDGLQRIVELDLHGSDQVLTELYLHGTEPNEIVATDVFHSGAYETVWGYTDLLGSLTSVASQASGDWKVVHNITREYGSDRQPLGDTTEAVLTSTTIWAGHHLDDDTGLLEAKARWYDPSSGRFISQDPIGFAAGDANLYRYVGNGPTDAVDPNGLEELNLLDHLTASNGTRTETLQLLDYAIQLRKIDSLQAAQSESRRNLFAEYGRAAENPFLSNRGTTLDQYQLLIGESQELSRNLRTARQFILENIEDGGLDELEIRYHRFLAGDAEGVGLTGANSVIDAMQVSQSHAINSSVSPLDFLAAGVARGLATQLANASKAELATAVSAATVEDAIANVTIFSPRLAPRGTSSSNSLWVRNGRELSTEWDNVRPRLNRQVHGSRNNPQVYDAFSDSLVTGQWHHGVISQRHLTAVSGLADRVSPSLGNSIRRFGNGNVKLLSPSQHSVADAFAHTRGFTPPWYASGTVVGPGQGAFRFSIGSPYRTWVGLTPTQRVWGSVVTVGVGYGSYQLGDGLGGYVFGDE
ncbi:RHS repeat-associated core domain-containing protein, partial [Stieleria sp. TO1_6]|uniref:RHS repeat-associated core domain-containing protein n=1 Tax=Stieleria tagensis TaxID=2956795 RepID=UPI00209B4D18